MCKKFKIIYFIGLVIIFILCFIVLEEPTKIIPSICSATFDRPLWFNLFIILIISYILLLVILEDKFK